jgi:hypothetical protein
MTSEIQDKPKEISHKETDGLEKNDISLSVRMISDSFEVVIKKQISLSTISQTIDRVIEEINKSKSFKPVSIITQKDKVRIPPSQFVTQKIEPEDKISFFAKKIGVDPEKLIGSELIGIKNDDVQIIKTTKLKPNEAGLLILSIKDLVFGQKSIPYEEWKSLCEASSIKSNTPFYMLASNYTLTKAIDKSKYKNSKELAINSKGEKVVKDALERILSQN